MDGIPKGEKDRMSANINKQFCILDLHHQRPIGCSKKVNMIGFNSSNARTWRVTGL